MQFLSRRDLSSAAGAFIGGSKALCSEGAKGHFKCGCILPVCSQAEGIEKGI